MIRRLGCLTVLVWLAACGGEPTTDEVTSVDSELSSHGPRGWSWHSHRPGHHHRHHNLDPICWKVCQHKECGEVRVLGHHECDCGTCDAPDTCGGGGERNQCGSGGGCTPKSASVACGAQTCGTAPDGCGGTVDCGGACQCVPKTASAACAPGQNCGTAADGCGGSISCGSCTAPDTCGAGGVANQCGCRRKTAQEACPSAQTCGIAADGCGGSVSCGTCTAPDVCVANQCGPSTIEVVSATYGGNCGAPKGNATDDLADACDGVTECTYSVFFQILGDPVPGCAKEYSAEYTCAGDPSPRSAFAHAEAGFGSQVSLTCP